MTPTPVDRLGRRVRVLVFVDYFLPGFKGGGPITTIRNMLSRLSDRFAFAILTRDRDLGDASSYADVPVDEWVELHGARIMYALAKSVGLRRVLRLIREERPDVIYVNSILSRRFGLVPLIAVQWLNRTGGLTPPARIVVAPRGECAPGALALKPLRKRAYLGLLRASGIWRDVCWQASSAHEAGDITAVVGRHARIRIAPDMTAPVLAAFPRAPKTCGSARIAFLGRISPMKNLEAAIRMVGELVGDVGFDIFGPAEDQAYLVRCREAVAALPAHVHVEFRGPVAAHTVVAQLADYDAMFLPSLGENFGHAVYEALSAGCPAVISDRTPWRDLERMGIGYVRPLEDPAGLVAALQAIVDMDEPTHCIMRERARRHALNIAGDQESVALNQALFSDE